MITTVLNEPAGAQGGTYREKQRFSIRVIAHSDAGIVFRFDFFNIFTSLTCWWVRTVVGIVNQAFFIVIHCSQNVSSSITMTISVHTTVSELGYLYHIQPI